MGKPPPLAPANGCHSTTTTNRPLTVMARSAPMANNCSSSSRDNHNIIATNGMSNVLCISPAGSELPQYSPSDSSSASSSFSSGDDRCHSATPHSSVSPPMELPNLVAVSYPFASVPFPWQPSTSTVAVDGSAIATTPNGLVNIKEVTSK